MKRLIRLFNMPKEANRSIIILALLQPLHKVVAIEIVTKATKTKIIISELEKSKLEIVSKFRIKIITI